MKTIITLVCSLLSLLVLTRVGPAPVKDQAKVSPTSLESLHLRLEREFGEEPGNGMSRMVRIHIHQARNNNLFTLVQGSETWKIQNLDMIGMLSDDPSVYQTPVVTANDAPMVYYLARNATRRDLDEFERGAIKKLINGEYVVKQQSNGEIRMMGALRATSDCLNCHVTKNDPNFLLRNALSERKKGMATPFKEGDVMGAFSYRITPAKAARF